MSTQASHRVSPSSWKDEVNLRLAAHQSRKGLSVVPEQPANQEHNVSDRAAKAAARVAARFSQAPSYAEMQAAEARVALREAEVATRAALEAQVAAQAALEHLERITEQQFEFETRQSEPMHLQAAAAESSLPAEISFFEPAEQTQPPSIGIAEAPEAESAHMETGVAQLTGVSHSPAIAQRQDVPQSEDTFVPRPYEFVEAQPIHGNVVRFPREIVATRRIRPRLSAAEQTVEEQLGQLSIFEVDPDSISIEPTASVAQEVVPVPSWSGPEWTSLDLEHEPAKTDEYDGEPPSVATSIHLAPLELRVMAAVVDFALIVALVCAGAAGIASHMHHAPAIKVAEIGGLVALVLTGLLYHAFFLMATMSTPGMMYARIGICTFDDEYPTRQQLRGRIGALLVSLLPLGLGMMWAIFDEDHLSWHDRISRTYPRRC